jgi:hypothetical protein
MTFIRRLWEEMIGRMHDKVEGLPTPGSTTLINRPHVNYQQQNTAHVNLKDKFVSSSERHVICFFLQYQFTLINRLYQANWD